MTVQQDRYDFRLATEVDYPFLTQMLFEAAYWRTDVERPPVDVGLARLDVARILEDWGRPEDTAVVAYSTNDQLIGAAWLRFWTAEFHSHGFIDPETPELGIAVRQRHRRRGVGTGLLRALFSHARRQSMRQVSLSIEQDNNPARTLYKKLGFQEVATAEGSWTMAIRLG